LDMVEANGRRAGLISGTEYSRSPLLDFQVIAFHP